MINIFEKPDQYLKELNEKKVFPDSVINKAIADYSGLSMICAWITKKCPLKCDKCFFKSNMDCGNMIEEEYQLTDEGITKLIKFVNDSNNGYLMLSGGGDPMVCLDKVNRIIENAETYRIVIVTSGFWANDYQRARTIIKDMYDSFKKRKCKKECKVIVRLSIDDFHLKPLKTMQAYENIINIFHDEYRDEENFCLMIHTIRNDNTIHSVAKVVHADIVYGVEGESDNSRVIKIVPKKAIMQFKTGYYINIGISKLFYSDLMIDLKNEESDLIKEAIKVITNDIENSEQDNPSYIQNALGKKGLDFWIDYNGNVTTWFNQDWNSIYNLYTNSYDEIVNRTLENPVTARFLKKGYENRNVIVSEVNPLAVIRAKAINLRDYYAAFILEENKTKLYYAIQGLKGYVEEYVISDKDLDILSKELQDTILKTSKNELISLYENADYDILNQYLDESAFDQQKWEDIFLLIALGHYQVKDEKLTKKIQYYNSKTGKHKTGISEFLVDFNDQLYSRLHKRISFMQEEAYAKMKKGDEDAV